MTTSAPSPGNGSENRPAPSLAKVLIPVAAILALVVGGLLAARVMTQSPPAEPVANASGAPAPAVAELRVGATLPDFELHSFGDGAKTVNASQLKSKVTLINFWATWCEACMVEMPSIVKLHQEYKDKNFDVVAVDVDSNPETVLPHTIKKYGMGFTVYTDTDSKLADFFQIQAIPLSVVINHDRKILMIENEGLDWNGSDFRAELEKWLAG